MAKRPYFVLSNEIGEFYKEFSCEFEFYTGFALSQKQKSVKSLHEQILKTNSNSKILEVSRRSESPLGIALSAFNLKYLNNNGEEYPVECVFQSSKVFINGQQYKDLLYKTASEAKTDERLKTSGSLLKFSFNDVDWDLEPKTCFYDYIYISALFRNKKLCDQLLNFDTFTDIEFNPQKSFNCQARSVAIAVALLKNNLIEKYLADKNLFRQIYESHFQPEQQKLF